MWIARDKDNSLWLYNEKPIRNEEENDWSPTDIVVGALDTNMFPELRWEDEPIEVELTRMKSNENQCNEITV